MLCTYIQVGELYLEGCTFDGKRLLENERNSPTVAAIPACNMAWVQKVTLPYPLSNNPPVVWLGFKYHISPVLQHAGNLYVLLALYTGH